MEPTVDQHDSQSSMEPSLLDEERFGIRVAKAVASSANVGALLEEHGARRIDLAILRVPVEDMAAIHRLEAAGARLMDTLVAYERDLTTAPPVVDVPEGVSVGPADQSDAAAAASLAREAFAKYVGHYHADPRLDDQACQEVYASWAARSCSSTEAADVVLLARHQGQIIGLTALKLEGTLAVGTLDAVAPPARGQGIYAALAVARMRRATAEGAERMLVTTHLGNWAAQTGLQRLGFSMTWAQHTLHLWSGHLPAPVD